MSDFEKTVLTTIEKYNMLEKGATVIVALSGGADSVSLLNALISIKEKYSLNIRAAHVNHNLRGAEAERDENFVRKICAEKNVELFVKSVDINIIADEEKISTELAGRQERYRFFEELNTRFNAKTATAHTADDNAETVIFNLIRGAGLNGLCGIKPVREGIIRPLINLGREEVERYCEENNLEFVTDSTNLTDDYTRNKIRHKIIPVIRELNPGFIGTVKNETEVLSGINSYIELKSEEYIKNAEVENGCSCEKLREIPDALKPAVIYTLLRKNGIMPESKHISLIAGILETGAVDLNGSLRAVSKQGTLRFIDKEVQENKFSEKELKLDMSFCYNGNKYSVKEINSEGALKKSVLEKDAVFRTRRAGDSFTLPRRKVTKSLKKLFNELKIPEEKRDSVMLLASGSEVLWIEGVGASESALSYEKNGFIINVEKERE